MRIIWWFSLLIPPLYTNRNQLAIGKIEHRMSFDTVAPLFETVRF